MSWVLLLAAISLGQAEPPPPPAPPPPPPAAEEEKKEQPAAPPEEPGEILRGTTVSGTPPPTAEGAPAAPAAPAASPSPGPGRTPTAPEETVEEIVAWINDDVVLLSDVQEAEQQALSAMMGAGRVSAEEMSAKVKEVQQQMLLSLISSRLLVQEADRLFDLNEIGKDLIKRWKERNNIKSDEDLDRILRDELKMSRKDLTDKLLLSAAPDYVVETQVRKSLSVSEQEARRYYDENLEDFLTPGQVTFREILLAAETSEDLRARLDEAVGIVERAKKGEDFAALVTEVSEGPSKALGGLIGPVPPSDLVPSVAEAIVGTSEGEIAGPIATPVGWQIIKVEQKLDEKTAPFESVRTQCEEAVRARKFAPAYEKYMTGLWKASTIEIRKDYQVRLPKQFQSLVVYR